MGNLIDGLVIVHIEEARRGSWIEVTLGVMTHRRGRGYELDDAAGETWCCMDAGCVICVMCKVNVNNVLVDNESWSLAVAL